MYFAMVLAETDTTFTLRFLDTRPGGVFAFKTDPLVEEVLKLFPKKIHFKREYEVANTSLTRKDKVKFCKENTTTKT